MTASQPNPQVDSKKNSKKTLVVILSILLLLMAISIGAAFYFEKEQPKKADKNDIAKEVFILPANAPKLEKPTDGTSSVIGQVSWNNEPVTNNTVSLCDYSNLLNKCNGQTYTGQTNQDGFYTIGKIKPGKYSVLINIPESNFIFFLQEGILDVKKFDLKADEILTVSNQDIFKVNLNLLYPKLNQDVSVGPLILKWDKYPAAKYFQVTLRTNPKDGVGDSVFFEQKTEFNEFEVKEDLSNCTYKWNVSGFNDKGKVVEKEGEFIFSGGTKSC